LNDLYRGLVSSSKKSVFEPSRLTLLGAGKKFKKAELVPILSGMITQHIIMEMSEKNRMGFRNTHVKFGTGADAVGNGRKKFLIEVAGKPKKAPAAAKPKAAEKPKPVSPLPHSPAQLAPAPSAPHPPPISLRARAVQDQEGQGRRSGDRRRG
jgi:hypothetical protein